MEMEQKAIALYGTTEDVCEAGYMLEDGTLLDFSGKRDGGEAGVRYMEHREVYELYPTAVDSTEAMKEFVKDTGAIRLSFDKYRNALMIDITTETGVTELQNTMLCRLAARIPEVFIDFFDNWYSEAPAAEYSLSMPHLSEIKRVLDEMNRHLTKQRKGEVFR